MMTSIIRREPDTFSLQEPNEPHRRHHHHDHHQSTYWARIMPEDLQPRRSHSHHTGQEAKWGRGGAEGAVWEEEMQPLPRINLISATSKFSKFNVEVNAAINLDDDDFIALWATGRKPFQFQQYHSV